MENQMNFVWISNLHSEKPQWIVFSYVCTLNKLIHNVMPKRNGWVRECEKGVERENRWLTWDFVTVCVCVCWIRRKKTSISHWFDNIYSNKCLITSRSYTKCKADLAVEFTTLSHQIRLRTMCCCSTICYSLYDKHI